MTSTEVLQIGAVFQTPATIAPGVQDYQRDMRAKAVHLKQQQEMAKRGIAIRPIGLCYTHDIQTRLPDYFWMSWEVFDLKATPEDGKPN